MNSTGWALPELGSKDLRSVQFHLPSTEGAWGEASGMSFLSNVFLIVGLCFGFGSSVVLKVWSVSRPGHDVFAPNSLSKSVQHGAWEPAETPSSSSTEEPSNRFGPGHKGPEGARWCYSPPSYPLLNVLALYQSCKESKTEMDEVCGLPNIFIYFLYLL